MSNIMAIRKVSESQSRRKNHVQTRNCAAAEVGRHSSLIWFMSYLTSIVPFEFQIFAKMPLILHVSDSSRGGQHLLSIGLSCLRDKEAEESFIVEKR